MRPTIPSHDLEGGGPIFKQLARRLAESIFSQDFKLGDSLPTEQELCRRYAVSRHTVRGALATLRSMGLIESRQGVGSVVVNSSPETRFVETFASTDELIRSGRGTPLRVLSVGEVAADDLLAQELRGQVGQCYLRIAGLRPSDNKPDAFLAGYVEVYVHSIYAGVRDHLNELQSAVAEVVHAVYGLQIHRIEQEIVVTRIEEEGARFLGVNEGEPALKITRWYFGANGNCFQVAVSHYPMGRFAYRSVLRRGGS